MHAPVWPRVRRIGPRAHPGAVHRDVAYLLWLTRRVATNSALALAVLGLGRGVARAADSPGFDPSTTFLVPSVALYSRSSPTLGDLDAAGDLDLIAGDEGQGQFHSFENTGFAFLPRFVERTVAENPLDGEDVGRRSSPTLVDLDADHDLDLVSGEETGELTVCYPPEPTFLSALRCSAGLRASGGLCRTTTAASTRSSRRGRSGTPSARRRTR